MRPLTIVRHIVRSDIANILHRRLAVALQDYVPLEYGITVGPETPKEDWNALFTKVNAAEEAAHGKGKSPSAIFSRFALKVGENREFIEPWVGLIPDEFGLAVVKSAIAILLNVSRLSCCPGPEQRMNDG